MAVLELGLFACPLQATGAAAQPMVAAAAAAADCSSLLMKPNFHINRREKKRLYRKWNDSRADDTHRMLADDAERRAELVRPNVVALVV